MQSVDKGFFGEISGTGYWLHEPARFAIAAYLYGRGSANLVLLTRQIGLTWGNLTSHVTKLKRAGYIRTTKETSVRKPHTRIRLTAQGRTALEKYCRTIGKVLDGFNGRQPQIGSGSEAPGEGLRAAVSVHPGARRRRGTSAPDRLIDALRKSPLFSDLDEDELSEISRVAVERHFESGQFLYFEDESLDHVCIIAEGRVKFLRNSPSGREFILAFRGQGYAIGNTALFLGKPAPAAREAQYPRGIPKKA